MKTFLKAIKAAEKTSSKLEKAKLLAGMSKDGQRLVKEAFDPFRVFHIRAWDRPLASYEDSPIEPFFELLDDLHNRKISGDAARAKVVQVLTGFTADTQEYLGRVIKKDLKCGASESTFNKIYKDLIPEFSYMRCSLPKHVKLDKFNWKKGVYSQEKADGMFVNINVEKDGEGKSIEMYTRSGTSIPTEGRAEWMVLKHILKPGTQSHGELLVVRDNEILPREVGNGIINAMIKGSGLEEGCTIIVRLWDQIPLSAVAVKGKHDVGYVFRFTDLQSQVQADKHMAGDHKLFDTVETRIVYSYDEAVEHYNEMLAQGKEGTIFKEPSAPWIDGTSKWQVKLKLEVDVELRVVGFRPGEGKNAKTFGALECESSDGLFAVGVSGISDDLRAEIHNDREGWTDAIVTVRGNNIMPPTKTNKRYSMFLPRLVERRTDKSEADSLQKIIDQFESAMKGNK